MPRPKRAKVASNAPSTRVATFTQMSQSTDIANEDTETRRTAPKTRRKATAPTTKDKGVTKSSKRARSVVAETEGQSGDLSAMERLRKRRSGEAMERVSEPPVGGDDQPAKPQRGGRTSATNASSSGPAARHATPLAVLEDSPDDLYGLSPQGERSQLELQKQIEKRRLSQGHGVVPSSVAKAHPTPMQEASLLAFKNFRRRARQPSILRTRRMSMQSTTQLGLDSDIDDFDPDDESTPLNLGKYASEDEAENTGADRTSSSRKRKLSQFAADVQMPRSSPPMDEPIDDAMELMRDTIDLARVRSSSPPADEPDLPEFVPETAQNTQDQRPDDWDEIMAPPKSSSSLEAEEREERPAVQAKATQRPQRARRAERNSRASTGDKSTTTKTKSKRPVLSTADLESLLPQRHNRRTRRAKPDAFEIPSDSDAASEVEDAPTREPSRTPNRSKKADARKKTQAITPVRATSKAKKTRRTLKSPLSVSKASGRTNAAKSTTKKTYGRQSNVSDKENETSVFDVDDGGSMDDEIVVGAKSSKKPGRLANAKQSEEIKAMKAKFAEVDDWEMEFESVEAGVEGSSWR